MIEYNEHMKSADIANQYTSYNFIIDTHRKKKKTKNVIMYLINCLLKKLKKITDNKIFVSLHAT